MPSDRSARIAVPTNNPQDPDFIVPTGGEFDGVVPIGSDGNINCTGSLLTTGRHLLTAAHCFNFQQPTPNLSPNPNNYSVYFDVPTGRITASIADIVVHPQWQNDDSFNNDIAIIELATTAPETANRYSIYTQFDEVGRVMQRVGYGIAGTGETGEGSDRTAVKRMGWNRYDALADWLNVEPDINIVPGTQLAYDFDDGTPEHDAIGREFGIHDWGLPEREVGSSRGDSGGPSFIDGQIAGIVSSGWSSSIPGVDVTNENDTSFGEIFTDTRVSAYAGFIGRTIANSLAGDDVLAGTNRDDILNGNQGSDRLLGWAGNDTLFGGRGTDRLEAASGHDILNGNLENDFLTGGNGNDWLFGGQQADSLEAGLGNDTLSGDLGKDTLLGGGGEDVFWLRTAAATNNPQQSDRIEDFLPGSDRIGFDTPISLSSDIRMQTGTLDNSPGTFLQSSHGHLIFGFVPGLSPDQLAGTFTHVAIP
jgi:hypothetical protein